MARTFLADVESGQGAELDRWDIPDGSQKSSIVEPVHPLECCVFKPDRGCARGHVGVPSDPLRSTKREGAS